jgi:hypothetical protein
VKRSQAAGETDKQAEHHQGEQGEDGWIRVRGCRCAEGVGLGLELACRVGACGEDRVSFSAEGEGLRQVAPFYRAASITHRVTRAAFVRRAGAVGRPIRARGILASRPAVAARFAAARFPAGSTFFLVSAFFASWAAFFAVSWAAFFAVSWAAFFAVSWAAFFAVSWAAFFASLARLVLFGRLFVFGRLLNVGEWRRGELRNGGLAGRRKSECKEGKEDREPHPDRPLFQTPVRQNSSRLGSNPQGPLERLRNNAPSGQRFRCGETDKDIRFLRP